MEKFLISEDEKGRKILEEIHHYCRKYRYSFPNLEIEDFEQEIALKIVKYLPENFESGQHFTNWLRLYIGRFASNTMRDWFNKRSRSISAFTGNGNLTDDNNWLTPFIEQATVKQYIARNNFLDKKQSVTNLLIEGNLHPKHQEIFFNRAEFGRNSTSRIASQFGMHRKSIYLIYKQISSWLRSKQ